MKRLQLRPDDGGERATAGDAGKTRQLDWMRTLPAALWGHVASYNRGRDHVMLWRTARAFWRTLRSGAAAPAELRVSDLGAFVARVARTTRSRDDAALAPWLRPQRLWFTNALEPNSLARFVRLGALTHRLQHLVMGDQNTNHLLLPLLHHFPNLRHLHGSDTLTPVRELPKGTPWSPTQWLGPYDMHEAPAQLECFLTRSHVHVYGLEPFVACRRTLTSLGDVCLYTTAHLEQLQTFSALRSLRLSLAVRSETDAPFTRRPTLFRPDSSLSSSPCSLPITALDLAVGTVGFCIGQLRSLASSLRTLCLTTHGELHDPRGLDQLTCLTDLAIAAQGFQPHAFALPPSLRTLRVRGGPNAVLRTVAPESLAHVDTVELSYRRARSAPFATWSGALRHMRALRHLSLDYPIDSPVPSSVSTTTRTAPVTADELAQLPTSICVFEYAGPGCLDLRPLARWPDLHTFAYRTPQYVGIESLRAHDLGVLPEYCLWAPLRALRSLTVWHYWTDASELFPALVDFFFISRSPLVVTRRDELVRAFPQLGRFEPDPKPSCYLHRPSDLCEAICCCCPLRSYFPPVDP